MLESVVDTALASRLQEVIVVLGHRGDELALLLQNRSVKIARNFDYRQGQSLSVKAGLSRLDPPSDAALFLFADQPLITPEIIDRLIDAYLTSDAPIVLPVCAGRRGSPVLFARKTFTRMEHLEHDCGARPLFTEYGERILKLPIEDSAIHFDIDTEEVYQELPS